MNDRLSFSRFAGIGLEDDVPDSTTICRFRNSLVSANAYEALLNEINRQLEAAGVLVKSGAIVDASVTDSLRRPRGRKVYEMVEDRHEDEQKQDGKGVMTGSQTPRLTWKRSKSRM